MAPAEGISLAFTSHLLAPALAELHAWIDTKDARLAVTAAISVAACAGKSPAVSAFADACLGFGGRRIIADEGRLGRPFVATPQHDASRHWTHWPLTLPNSRRELVTAVTRSLLRCRCGVQLSDDGKATSGTAQCDTRRLSVPPVIAVRPCPAQFAALAAITETCEQAAGSGDRIDGIVTLALESCWDVSSVQGVAAGVRACRIWGATTLRGLVVPWVAAAAVEEMLRASPHLTLLSAHATPVAAALAHAAATTAPAFRPIPHFSSALHTLDLTSAPNTDAALDAIANGLPRLRALTISVYFRNGVTAAAWRRNLLALLRRLEVLELCSIDEKVFTAVDSLPDSLADSEPLLSSSPLALSWVSRLADLPVVPLRTLALSSGPNVHGDAAAFVEAVGRHQQYQSGGSSAGLFELRLADVRPDTWLAAPRTVTHLRIDNPHFNEANLVAIFDGVRLPNLKCLTLASCHSIFPHEVVYRKASLAAALAGSPLRAATHPTLRTLRVECPLDADSGRTARREAWVAAVLGASHGGSMDGTGGRFPRLRHVVFNGEPLRGWPHHDPFVPPSQPPRVLAFVQRVAAALTSMCTSSGFK